MYIHTNTHIHTYTHTPHFSAQALKALTRWDPRAYSFLHTLVVDSTLKLRALEQIHEKRLCKALACVCVCKYIHIHAYIHVYIHTCKFVCILASLYAFLQVCMHSCKFVCILTFRDSRADTLIRTFFESGLALHGGTHNQS
jgi:hypothetical protein